MKTGYRLCLGCLEDWTGSPDPLCPACKIEFANRAGATSDWKGEPETHGWWGGSLTDDGNDHVVDADDIKEGYSIEWVKD